MVRAPEYEAMDEARSRMARRAFNEVCGEEGPWLLEAIPEDPRAMISAGPEPHTDYRVLERTTGREVAVLYSNGGHDLHDAAFEPYLLRIAALREEAAHQAYRREVRGPDLTPS